MNVTMTLTAEQADALVRACDLAYRVASGQWRDVAQYAGDHNQRTEACCRFYGRTGDVLEAESRGAFLLAPGSYHGIGSPDLTPDIARLHAVGHTLRHALAWHRYPEGGGTVDFDRPMSFQPASEPLPVVEVKP